MIGSAPLTYLMVRPGYLAGRSLLMNAATYILIFMKLFRIFRHIVVAFSTPAGTPPDVIRTPQGWPSRTWHCQEWRRPRRLCSRPHSRPSPHQGRTASSPGRKSRAAWQSWSPAPGTFNVKAVQARTRIQNIMCYAEFSTWPHQKPRHQQRRRGRRETDWAGAASPPSRGWQADALEGEKTWDADLLVPISSWYNIQWCTK